MNYRGYSVLALSSAALAVLATLGCLVAVATGQPMLLGASGVVAVVSVAAAVLSVLDG